MNGMNATDGTALNGDAHLAQSLGDILTTPLGSRVMRRDYGSMLFELIDRPINAAVRMLLHAATAIAIARWEPRLRLTRVTLGGDPVNGMLTIRIEGQRTDRAVGTELVSLSIPIRRANGCAIANASSS